MTSLVPEMAETLALYGDLQTHFRCDTPETAGALGVIYLGGKHRNDSKKVVARASQKIILKSLLT